MPEANPADVKEPAGGDDIGVVADPGESSRPVQQDGSGDHLTLDDGLMDTIDITPADEGGAEQDAAKTSTDEGKKKEAEEEPGKEEPPEGGDQPKSGFKLLDKDGNEVPFGDHPRFQELTSQIAELKGKLEAGGQAAKPSQGEQEPEFTDVSTLNEEEVRQWMDEDPIGYQANLAKQIKAEIHAESNQHSARQAIDKTFSSYEKDNPDFRSMWDSGKLKDYMRENPGHNAISAHMTLTAEAKAKAREADIRKEERQKVMREFKIKGNAGGLADVGGGERPKSSTSDVRLNDPDKYGGAEAVLAARYKERLQMAGTR